MNFEKIEAAFGFLLENTQTIQQILSTNAYDALIEQNSTYLAGQALNQDIEENNLRLKELHMTPEEWRRAFQFLLIKIQQTEPLQYNHQFTPDAIGFLLLFLLDQLAPETTKDQALSILEIGSGTGNLAFTLLHHSQKQLDYFGIEVDDLLIDLSASMADIIGASIGLAQGDAVRPQILKSSQVILSDLPVGYYPDDSIARRYQVASQTEHTYAHHLLMEQSLKYLTPDGIAIFLAPNNLLSSPQSPLLKHWLQEQADILAVLTLPETLFGHPERAKSIFILRKKQAEECETFLYLFQDLQDSQEIHDFTEKFKNWKLDHAISPKIWYTIVENA